MCHLRAGLVAVLCCLLLTACGGGTSGSEEANEPSGQSGAATPAAEKRFFTKADSDAINAVAGPAQAAGTKAQARANLVRCNRASDRGYDAWRTCWHSLLDPLKLALVGVGAEFQRLAERDLPEKCVDQLTQARQAFDAMAAQVAGLLEGIDSQRRADQTKAIRDYDPTLQQLAAGFTKPFQAVTQVCYSPEDLASINASPSPSP